MRRFTEPREVQCDVLVVGLAVERPADKLVIIIDLDTLEYKA